MKLWAENVQIVSEVQTPQVSTCLGMVLLMEEILHPDV